MYGQGGGVVTWRAVLIGLLLACLLAGVGYINNRVIELEPIEAWHQIPVSVYGLVVLASLTILPLLARFGKRGGMRPAELAVIMMLMLVSLSIPGRGLLEQFTSVCAMPVHWERVNPGWQQRGLLGLAPDRMFIDEGPNHPDALHNYINGKSDGIEPISLGDVPWGAWRGPLSTYLPMIVLLNGATLCLALIVHRQWSYHERLRYPIAEVGTTLIARGKDQLMPPIYRSRLFWMGLAVVCAIRWTNGLYEWTDGEFIQIPMMLDARVAAQKYPMFASAPWGMQLLEIRLFPIVIGFSFFLASDISFSLGISQYLYVAVGAFLITRGVDMSSSYMAGGPMGWHRAGAYAAFAVIIFYTGRRFYLAVLRRALGAGGEDVLPRYTVWACRIMLICLTLLVVLILQLGVSWPLAVLTVGLMMLTFLGVARITAETGLFFVQPRWQAMGVLLGLFGAYALGPRGLVVIGLLCCVLTIDPSQSLMPYFTNALKVCTNLGVRPGRAGLVAMGTWLLALAVGLTVVLWASYNYGATRYSWSFERVPTMPFRPALREVTQLDLAGQRQASMDLGPLERLGAMRPDSRFIWGAATGVGLVLLLGLMRLRLARWPLHPVLALVWSTHPMAMFHHSFLIGWCIKEGMLRVGGVRTYEKAKPLMIGLIAGELLAAMVLMAIGALYYARTVQLPPTTPIMPR